MNTAETPSRSDHDEYWKDAFDAFLPDLLAVIAPEVTSAIDWPRGIEPIPHGLFPDALESSTGARYPDRVYRVFLRSGVPAALYLHFEFEAGRKNDFPKRVMVYRMRLGLKFDQPIFTLAFLLDADPRYRPTEYVEETFGNVLRFEFKSVKLLDFAACEEEFLASGNPGKILIAIKLIDLRVKDPDARLAEKRRVLRRLVDVIRENPVLRSLTRYLIQGIMTSRSREREFHQEVLALEQEHHMPFVTIFEKEAEERGQLAGEARGQLAGEARGELRATLRERRDAIVRILRARFPEVSNEVLERIQAIEDPALLEELLVRAAVVPKASDFGSTLTE